MGIVARLARPAAFRADLSLTDEKAWDRSLWNLIGAVSTSGETVTEQNALTFSPVWNAIALIAGSTASMPLHLMQRKGERKRIADDLRPYRVMHDQWNPYVSAMQGREALLAHVLAWGNGYAEIVRNGYGDLVELWNIAPHRVTPKMQDGALVYEIRMERSAPVALPRAKVLHIAGLGFDGFVGYSVVAMARKSLGLGMALETFGSQFFGQGTHPGVIVSHPGKLNAESHANLRKSLTDSYSGLGQSHRLMLLEDGLKVEKIGIPPEDSQFLESRQFSITEVARWFNLPVHKLKELSRSTNNNIEHQGIEYYVDCLLPWLVRLEQSYGMQLLTETERDLSGRGRLYWKHNANAILRGDTAARGEFYTKMFGIGAMSINEIRALEDLDPVDGGDIHLVPLNMTTLENAGKPPEPTPAPALPTPEPEPARRNGDGEPARRGER